MKLSQNKTKAPSRLTITPEKRSEIVEYWKRERDNRVSVIAKHFNEPESVVLNTIDWYLSGLTPKFNDKDE